MVKKSIFYGEYFDLVFPNENKTAIKFWQNQIIKFGDPILELASGTGRITIPLAETGLDITGIDISKKMIDLARSKASAQNLDIDFLVKDIRNFKFDKKFSLIFIPANSLSHLISLKDIESCFQSIRKNLAGEGRFIIDIFNPDFNILNRDPEKRYPFEEIIDPATQEKIKITQSNYYDKASQVNHIKFYYQFPQDQKERIEEIKMRIFYPREIEALIKYNGFKIEEKFGDYGGNKFKSESNKQIIVCSKKV